MSAKVAFEAWCTFIGIFVLLYSSPIQAKTLKLKPDLHCELQKSAAIFDRLGRGAQKVNLGATARVLILEVKGRRTHVQKDDGSKGYMKTRRLRKVCKLSEAVPSNETTTRPTPNTQTIELCTLTKSAATYSDSRLRARQGTARRGETLEIVSKKPRVWALRPWTGDASVTKGGDPLKSQYAKSKRLKQVCQFNDHLVTSPLPPEEELGELADSDPSGLPKDDSQSPEALTESTPTPMGDSQSKEEDSTTPELSTIEEPSAQQPVSIPSPEREPTPPPPSTDTMESLEKVDLMGDRYWLDRDRKVAVRDVTLTNANLPPLLAESLSSVIAAELQYRSRGRFQVISRGDLRNIIAQQTEAQMMGCASDSCMMDLAELANADNILTSSVERLGESTILTIELFDTELQRVMRRQAVAWRGDDAGLVDLARSYLTWIVEGSRAADMRGSLQVVSDQDGAKALINGKEMGKTPINLLPDLPIGLHELRLDKNGYLPHDQPFVIQANETTLIQLSLIDESSLTPWYRSWWTWSGAALLVGGATSALLLNQGLGAEQPLCLSECVQDPWYTNGWTVTGVALGALSLGASAYIAWNWDDVLETWLNFTESDEETNPGESKPTDPREDIITAGFRRPL